MRQKTIKNGGGIAIHIKEGINYLCQKNLEYDEIEAMLLEILVERGNSFLIGIMSCPQTHQNTYTKILNRSWLADILNNILLLNK